METLVGVVGKLMYQSEENDFKVFQLKRKDRSLIRIIGNFPVLLSGTKVEVHGNYKNHPKYGISFNSDAHSFDYDNSVQSVALYLQSIAKWVGPERSWALANKFGERLQEVIEKTPQRLAEVEGIGEKVALSIAEAWELNKEMKGIRIFLHSLGLGQLKIRKIITMFGPNTEDILKTNPWILFSHGFGFTTCDHIASKLEKDMRDPVRFRYFILYLLQDCLNQGHLFLYPQQVIDSFNIFNKKTPFPFKDGDFTVYDIAPHIKELIKEGYIVNDDNRLYQIDSFFYETESARLLSKIENNKNPSKLSKIDIEAFINRYEAQERNSTDKKDFKLSDAQRDAIRSFAVDRILIITGGPGTGKCLGYNTPVLMYDGSIKMVQDIKAGDILMGDDSSPRNVLSTICGIDNMYEVTPVKGMSYTVNSAHILSLKESPTGDGRFIKGRIRDVPIKEYLGFCAKTKHHLKGYRVPVEFAEREVPIDPYLIGMWLGNGSKDCTRISTPFSEVVQHISQLIQPLGLVISKIKGDNVDYYIGCDKKDSHPTKSHSSWNNTFLSVLRNLDLINNKHLPDIYRINSRKNRLELLAGFIDSDGYSDIKDKGFDFAFTSEKMAEDVVYVARSLGFSAYVKKCRKKYKSFTKGKWYTGEVNAYRFFISGDGLTEIPVIAKKRKTFARKQKKDTLVTGIEVKSIGTGNYYGFEIDGNKRFLLGDFTVTHNTTITKALVQLMKENSISFELLTPTGIAAKKLGTTAGCEAYTIHRRLGYKGSSWDYNALNKYNTEVVIVDEMSMVDQEVFYRLLSALYSTTRMVFVGDTDQLPSVGPGSVLRELIGSQLIKTIFLDKIFRQEQCSDIIKEAKKIRDGDTDLSLFSPDKSKDIWHIRDKDPDRIERTIIKFAAQLKDSIKTKGNKLAFQIITPRNQGPLSVDSLNTALQQALNPPDKDKKEVIINKVVIRKGDRVMVRKNNYELGVFNGDIGKVVFITMDNIVVDLEDFNGEYRRVEIPMRIADEMLRLAYAITVHRSQGLEYPLVIIAFIRAHGNFLLQRNLLYTAVTRAKKKVIILGQASALEAAIQNDKIQKRNTRFSERIKEWMQGNGISMRDKYSNSSGCQNAAALDRLLSLEASGG